MRSVDDLVWNLSLLKLNMNTALSDIHSQNQSTSYELLYRALSYCIIYAQTDRYTAYYVIYQCTKWYYLTDVTTLWCFTPYARLTSLLQQQVATLRRDFRRLLHQLVVSNCNHPDVSLHIYYADMWVQHNPNNNFPATGPSQPGTVIAK